MNPAQHVLTLREYEAAQIGTTWNAVDRIVTARVAADLERLQAEARSDFFAIDRRSIKAQNYVGTVGLGERSIDILPKTDIDDDSTRRRLINMLTVSGMVPELEAGATGLGRSVPSLLDAFMSMYVRRLAMEWRRGHIRNYRKQDANRTFLRGKLLFQQQIRKNLLHPERFFTRADEFIEDVPVCQLLKAALRICYRFSVRNVLRLEAKTLLAEFEEVSDVEFTEDRLGQISVDRRAERFRPLLELAKILCRGCTPDRPGRYQTYALLFDMNVVFERYIGRLLVRLVCPPERSASLQVTGKSLLRRGQTGCFRLRPDVGIRRRGRLEFLIDTKWKRLDPARPYAGVSQADMYQAYAYAKEFETSRVVLLYPQAAGIGRHVARYRHNPGDADSPVVDVCTIDVAQPPSGHASNSVAHQLAGLLEVD